MFVIFSGTFLHLRRLVPIFYCNLWLVDCWTTQKKIALLLAQWFQTRSMWYSILYLEGSLTVTWWLMSTFQFEPLCIFMVINFSGVVHYSWSRTCSNVRRNRPAGLVLQVNDCIIIIIYYILLFTIWVIALTVRLIVVVHLIIANCWVSPRHNLTPPLGLRHPSGCRDFCH